MNYTEFKTYEHNFNKPSYINVRYFNAAGKFLFEELLFANIEGVRYLMELDAFADNPLFAGAARFRRNAGFRLTAHGMAFRAGGREGGGEALPQRLLPGPVERRRCADMGR